MLKISNISYAYDKPLLKDFSMEVTSKERVAITGPSGVGKSTLVKIISGHYFPQRGSIFLNEVNISGQPSRKIVLVDQEDDLFPWLKVDKQLSTFGADQVTTQELLKIVELEKYKHLYPQELSGGMKQRLSIARALSLKPEVIVFDESFNSLDSALRSRLITRIDHYAKSISATLIFVSHNFDQFDLTFNQKICLS
jgi:NitT/TauT family transport system ATP-binding protein